MSEGVDRRRWRWRWVWRAVPGGVEGLEVPEEVSSELGVGSSGIGLAGWGGVPAGGVRGHVCGGAVPVGGRAEAVEGGGLLGVGRGDISGMTLPAAAPGAGEGVALGPG